MSDSKVTSSTLLGPGRIEIGDNSQPAALEPGAVLLRIIAPRISDGLGRPR